MRVVKGECVELMSLLGNRSVDIIMTDPPYSKHTHEAGRRGASRDYREPGAGKKTRRCEIMRNRDLGFAHLATDLRRACAEQFARIARRWILVFTDHEGGEGWKRDLIDAGAEFVRFGIWRKLAATPQFTGDRPGTGHEVIVIAHAHREKGSGRMQWNGGGRHAYWEAPIVQSWSGEGRIHTTQKPLQLMEALVRDFTNRGEFVLDPFAGGGSTLVACKRLGRRGLGFELDAKYVHGANQRIRREVETPDLFEHFGQKREQLQLGLG